MGCSGHHKAQVRCSDSNTDSRASSELLMPLEPGYRHKLFWANIAQSDAAIKGSRMKLCHINIDLLLEAEVCLARVVPAVAQRGKLWLPLCGNAFDCLVHGQYVMTCHMGQVVHWVLNQALKLTVGQVKRLNL